MIGVRNLEPYNLLDVNNPIVEIDSGEKESFQRTETGSGPNASFMQVRSIQHCL